jgi:hypothetical protein
VPELTFRLDGATPVPFAASPQIAFAVRVSNADPAQPVHSAMLRCQIQIDASARMHSASEMEGLADLFGEGPVWARASRRLLWAHTTAVVPAFAAEVVFEIHAPCTYDLFVASSKYLRALSGGQVPVVMLFSGTVFHAGADGALQAAPVPWSSEARVAMPVHVWQQAIDQHYGGRAPLPVSTEVLERLGRYKTRCGLPTWDAAIDSLLPPDAGAAR